MELNDFREVNGGTWWCAGDLCFCFCFFFFFFSGTAFCCISGSFVGSFWLDLCLNWTVPLTTWSKQWRSRCLILMKDHGVLVSEGKGSSLPVKLNVFMAQCLPSFPADTPNLNTPVPHFEAFAPKKSWSRLFKVNTKNAGKKQQLYWRCFFFFSCGLSTTSHIILVLYGCYAAHIIRSCAILQCLNTALLHFSRWFDDLMK